MRQRRRNFCGYPKISTHVLVLSQQIHNFLGMMQKKMLNE
jgi:hypothetical protein